VCLAKRKVREARLDGARETSPATDKSREVGNYGHVLRELEKQLPMACHLSLSNCAEVARYKSQQKY